MSTNRYSRNIACIGVEGQKRLSTSSVFVIGCGALGGQVIMQLAAAGVGKIGIADFDTIDISNLQRQLFFSEAQAGLFKARTIAERASSLNSEVKIEVYEKLIRRSDGPAILSSYDFIVDATDNPATKYMTDSLCREIGRPGCIAGVAGWTGQIMCITGQTDDESLRFSDVFPAPDEGNAVLPCEVLGVMGPTAAAIASLQAAETLKYLLGIGTPMVNRILSIDLLTMIFNNLEA